jgi:hypothetical protein
MLLANGDLVTLFAAERLSDAIETLLHQDTWPFS